jgi:hypothetical protein
MKKFIYLIVLGLFAITSCKRDDAIDINPANKLNFSTDSILFDTIFTSIGSTSRTMKVFNYSKKAIQISNISLVGGSSSPFKININGVAQSSLNDVRLNGNDSLYIFVKAVINPNLANSPFLVQDTLEFLTNGNLQKIPVVAYGQNAVYLNSKTLDPNFIFTKNKPYVIFNSVTVAQNNTASIKPGARLYFHAGSKMNVYGTLLANGSLNDSITFCSDRTERIYQDEPGQWKGIHYFMNSIDNTLNYCTIKNAIIGLEVDSLSSNSKPKLLITNSIIKTHTVAGLISYSAHIVGINNLFYDCGKYLMIGLYGGNYEFYQNTFSNSNKNFTRQTPSVLFSDNTEDGISKYKKLNINFINNIVWGNMDNEFMINSKNASLLNSNIQTNLIKTIGSINQGNNILNQDPLFQDTKKDNYLLVGNSPAQNVGTDLSANFYYNQFIKKDLSNTLRIFPSDLGCFEIK